MSDRAYLCGLVGEDIQASRSPWLHEREADELGLRLIYSLYDLASSRHESDALAETLSAARRMGFAGLNITHPFKQRVIPLLDELDETARRIGAVNTVTFRAGRSVGSNTDYVGFSEGLRRGLQDAAFETVVQVGAGGAGAATATALLDHGASTLRIHDVEPERAYQLRDLLRGHAKAASVTVVTDVGDALVDADGVVNATPVGMTGHDGIPVPTACLRSEMWVADIIYFPLETQLLRAARERGCRTLDGVTMVVFQAAAAFHSFTGVAPDQERMLTGARAHWSDVRSGS